MADERIGDRGVIGNMRTVALVALISAAFNLDRTLDEAR